LHCAVPIGIRLHDGQQILPVHFFEHAVIVAQVRQSDFCN